MSSGRQIHPHPPQLVCPAWGSHQPALGWVRAFETPTLPPIKPTAALKGDYNKGMQSQNENERCKQMFAELTLISQTRPMLSRALRMKNGYDKREPTPSRNRKPIHTHVRLCYATYDTALVCMKRSTDKRTHGRIDGFAASVTTLTRFPIVAPSVPRRKHPHTRHGHSSDAVLIRVLRRLPHTYHINTKTHSQKATHPDTQTRPCSHLHASS